MLCYDYIRLNKTCLKGEKSMKALVFDFDGVFVLDSDGIFKKEAWGRALALYGERYKPYLDEGNSMFGFGKSGGRMEIFRYICERLGEPADRLDELVAKAGKVFDEYVQKRILEAGLVSGAMEMLESLSVQGLSLYLNSGTATDALKRSAANLKIDHFFNDILGSTKSKVDNLLSVVAREHTEPMNIVVVGDGDSDIKAAKEVGCGFIGVSNRWNKWGEDNNKPFPLPLVTDLRDIVKFF